VHIAETNGLQGLNVAHKLQEIMKFRPLHDRVVVSLAHADTQAGHVLFGRRSGFPMKMGETCAVSLTVLRLPSATVQAWEPARRHLPD